MESHGVVRFLISAVNLVLLPALAGAAPVIALAASPAEKECSLLYDQFSASLSPKTPLADPTKFEQLKKIPAQTYFADGKASDSQLVQFRSDFDSLLEQRRLSGQMSKGEEKAFRGWLKERSKLGLPYPDLTPDVIKSLGADHTLGFVQDATIKVYESYSSWAAAGGRIAEKLNPSDMAEISLSATKTIVGNTGNLLKNGFVSGPIAAIVGAVAAPYVQPLVENLMQASAVINKRPAAVVQTVVSKYIGKLTKQMTAAAKTTGALDVTNFEGMDRDEAKTVMDGFENRYYDIFSSMNGYLAPYKRAGRDLINGWLLDEPRNYATAVSTFRMQYTQNQSLLIQLQDKIEASAKPPTERDQALLKQYKDDMEIAEDGMAATLASWTIYKFMFAEVSRKPQFEGANGTILNDTLERYEKSMNMDKYRNELSGKIREAFGNFDPTFKDLNKLDKPKK